MKNKNSTQPAIPPTSDVNSRPQALIQENSFFFKIMSRDLIYYLSIKYPIFLQMFEKDREKLEQRTGQHIITNFHLAICITHN